MTPMIPAAMSRGAFDLRWLMLGFLTAVLASIAAALLLAVAGRPEAIALYAVFGSFCHQQAERTWTFASHPLPVCVRCAGFYLGAFAALAVRAPFSMRGLLFAAGFALFTVAAEAASLWQPPGAVRWLSGILLGWSLASPASAVAARCRRPVG